MALVAGGSDAANEVDDSSVSVAAPAGQSTPIVQVVVPVLRRATKKRKLNIRAKALAMVVLSDDEVEEVEEVEGVEEVEEVEKVMSKSARVLEKERATPVVIKTSVSHFEGFLKVSEG